jgi:predicted AAA+ superfamily ATPase
MVYIKRILGDIALKTLARGKSILLLGARQTGKTTFVRHELKPDVEISFVRHVMKRTLIFWSRK